MMPYIFFSCLLCALLTQSSFAQTFQEYLTLFEPTKENYNFGGNLLEETIKQKKAISANFRVFIDNQTDTSTTYYPIGILGNQLIQNSYYAVLLVRENKNKPTLFALISRLYDSQGNLKPTRLDIGKEEGFLAFAGKDEDDAYSFFAGYDAKNARFSIYYRTESNRGGNYRAYTLNAEGYTRYSPTPDLAYDPYSNTTPYEPPTHAVKIDYQKDKSVRLKVGQTAYLPAPVHGSVGVGTHVESTKEAILQYLDGHNAFRKPQMSGETGGDGATYTFIFQARKVGKCHLIYKKYFRGKIEKTYKIKVQISK